jgi:hypothetical protein
MLHLLLLVAIANCEILQGGEKLCLGAMKEEDWTMSCELL